MDSSSSIDDWVAKLEREWDADNGFVGRLRFGDFDEHALARLVNLLKSIDIGAQACIPRSLVSVLWQIPYVMEWQVPHQTRNGGDVQNLHRAIATVNGEVERILGLP
jgi:hypothetical protein